MGTKIQWTDESWNPVVGCSKVSAGCENCYAEKFAVRLAAIELSRSAKQRMNLSSPYHVVTDGSGWNGKVATIPSKLEIPLHWRKPRRIFVCSMGDLFHPSVPVEFIAKVLSIISMSPRHTYQVLTKRPSRMEQFFTDKNRMWQLGARKLPLPNLHLGVSVENQKEMWRVGVLGRIPAAVKFISFEPLLGNITYCPIKMERLEWVIIGCESGPKRRLCKLEWVRDLVQQCKAADVRAFVKQLSISGKVEHNINKFPEDLRLRQYPQGQG